MTIVITDGESRYPDLTEEAAQKLRDQGVVIIALGIKVSPYQVNIMEVMEATIGVQCCLYSH